METEKLKLTGREKKQIRDTVELANSLLDHLKNAINDRQLFKDISRVSVDIADIREACLEINHIISQIDASLSQLDSEKTADAIMDLITQLEEIAYHTKLGKPKLDKLADYLYRKEEKSLSFSRNEVKLRNTKSKKVWSSQKADSINHDQGNS